MAAGLLGLLACAGQGPAVARHATQPRALGTEGSVAVRFGPLPPVTRRASPRRYAGRQAMGLGAAPRARGPEPLLATGPGTNAPHAASPIEPWTLPPGVPPRAWRAIVIHHTATRAGNAALFNREHLARGWDGLGYDFVIDNGRGGPDGRIEVGFRWSEQRVGAHAGSTEYNEYGVGICLVGDFHNDAQGPTPNQWAALVRLCRGLMARYGISARAVKAHSAVRDPRRGPTACPGKHFPWARLIAAISDDS